MNVPQYAEDGTLVSITRFSAQFDHNIQQGGGLWDLPVDCIGSSDSRHLSEINHEIAHTAVKAVLVDIPFTTVGGGISIWMMTSVYSAYNYDDIPITANPEKLAAARRVGGFLASPINWVKMYALQIDA